MYINCELRESNLRLFDLLYQELLPNLLVALAMPHLLLVDLWCIILSLVVAVQWMTLSLTLSMPEFATVIFIRLVL